MTVNLTITAADGAISTVTLLAPNVVSSFPDGSANASTAAPLFPTILNNYGPSGFTPGRYTSPSKGAFNSSTGQYQQPQWKVAGVDYGVGPNAAYGTTIPWKVVGVNALPSGVTGAGTNRLTVTTANTTLDGWDFTQGTTPVVGITVAASGCTITNCRMKKTADNTFPMLACSAASLVVKYCLFNGNGFDDSNSTEIVNYTYTGATSFATGATFQYNIFEYPGSDIMSPNSGGSPTFWWTFQYNVVLDGGCENGTHPDWLQLGSSGTHNWNMSYNFCLQRNTPVGSQPWVFGTQNSTGVQQGNCNNNVWLALNISSPAFPGSHNLNNMIWVTASEANRGAGMFITQNYLDPTASSGLWGGGGGTYSGNILLTTGAVSHP